jgi:hypothetical protein
LARWCRIRSRKSFSGLIVNNGLVLASGADGNRLAGRLAVIRVTGRRGSSLWKSLIGGRVISPYPIYATCDAKQRSDLWLSAELMAFSGLYCAGLANCRASGALADMASVHNENHHARLAQASISAVKSARPSMSRTAALGTGNFSAA